MRTRAPRAIAIVKGSTGDALRAAREQLVAVEEVENLTPGQEQKLICPISEYQRLQEWFIACDRIAPPYPPGSLLFFTAE